MLNYNSLIVQGAEYNLSRHWSKLQLCKKWVVSANWQIQHEQIFTFYTKNSILCNFVFTKIENIFVNVNFFEFQKLQTLLK